VTWNKFMILWAIVALALVAALPIIVLFTCWPVCASTALVALAGAPRRSWCDVGLPHARSSRRRSSSTRGHGLMTSFGSW